MDQVICVGILDSYAISEKPSILLNIIVKGVCKAKFVIGIEYQRIISVEIEIYRETIFVVNILDEKK